MSLGLVASLIAASAVTIAAGASIGILNLTTAITTFAILPAVLALDRRARDFEREGCIPLSRADQPDLWAMVDDIARAAGTTPPTSVLLSADVNAGVLQSGSFLGLRAGRRVMVLGLPLLTLMTEGQLRAVLAHEFGHYLGGDTRVGAVLYRASVGITRARMRVRTTLIRELFDDYGQLFERVALPIMREQEVAADLLAANVASPGDLRDALASFPGIHAVWEYHADHYLVPAWKLGLSVSDPFSPLTEQWNGRPGIRERALSAELARAPAPHDSHPSLAERLAVLPPPTAASPTEHGCLHLVHDVTRLEAALRRNFTPPAARAFARRDITFEDLPKEVAIPSGLAQAESLLRPIMRMSGASPASAAGSLTHLLDLFESGEASAIAQRLLGVRGTRASEAEGSATLTAFVAATLGYAMVVQGLAEYALALDGDEPFRVVQKHRSPLDLAALSARAVAGGDATAAVRKAVARRGLDLTWSLPRPESLDVGALAAQIANDWN